MEKFINVANLNQMPDMGKPWKPLIPYKNGNQITPEQLKAIVLNSDKVQEICMNYANGDRNKEQQLRTTVASILEEIGFKRNMAVVRFLGIVLNKLLTQMTGGVYVNVDSILSTKRQLARNQCPVLYLPTHRSYADFVLMSYMCFIHNLEIPAIAAGMDFHSMVGMGSMLRNTGAFFMRRSFSTDQMYWDVFREYVRTLTTKYHSGIEFFIEGTRSRSCKAVAPKIGLFSMILEPFMKRKIFDITIVPIAISYDRPVEESLFAYELLGVPKPKESTAKMFKAFDVMSENHGRMYVNFGANMSVYDFYDSKRAIYCSPNKPNDSALTKDRLELINQLAYDIVDKQQQTIVITTFNLIAIYFNYRSMVNLTLNRDQLKYGINQLCNFLRRFNAFLSCEIPSLAKSEVADALVVHSNVLQFSSPSNEAHLSLTIEKRVSDTSQVDPSKLKGHGLSARTMRRSLPIFLLQIHANPCLYWLHQPAFYVLLHRLQVSNERMATEMAQIKRIFSYEFITRKRMDTEEFNSVIEKINEFNILADIEITEMLLSAILPFVFCYYNVADAILNHIPTEVFNEKELFQTVQQRVEERLNAAASYVHPYCLSLDSIGNALASFISMQCIAKRTNKNGRAATQYIVDSDKLKHTFKQLESYCSVLTQFNALSNYLLLSKL